MDGPSPSQVVGYDIDMEVASTAQREPLVAWLDRLGKDGEVQQVAPLSGSPRGL